VSERTPAPDPTLLGLQPGRGDVEASLPEPIGHLAALRHQPDSSRLPSAAGTV